MKDEFELVVRFKAAHMAEAQAKAWDLVLSNLPPGTEYELRRVDQPETKETE